MIESSEQVKKQMESAPVLQGGRDDLKTIAENTAVAMGVYLWLTSPCKPRLLVLL